MKFHFMLKAQTSLLKYFKNISIYFLLPKYKTLFEAQDVVDFGLEE